MVSHATQHEWSLDNNPSNFDYARWELDLVDREKNSEIKEAIEDKVNGTHINDNEIARHRGAHL